VPRCFVPVWACWWVCRGSPWNCPPWGSPTVVSSGWSPRGFTTGGYPGLSSRVLPKVFTSSVPTNVSTGEVPPCGSPGRGPERRVPVWVSRSNVPPLCYRIRVPRNVFRLDCPLEMASRACSPSWFSLLGFYLSGFPVRVPRVVSPKVFPLRVPPRVLARGVSPCVFS
jgi:hypothetical protein